jgi:predicted sulfurtransferase
MGKNIVRLFAVLVFFNALSVFAAAPADAPRMAKEELKRRLGDKDIVVIDVRTKDDWEMSGSKIKGAVREDPQDTASWAAKYAKEKTIVLYCS